jgi:hypothetical protein
MGVQFDRMRTRLKKDCSKTSGFHHITISRHRDFTIVPSCFHHRTIVFSSSCHRTIAFSPSYHRVFIIVSSYHRVFTIVPSCIAGKDETKNHYCPNGTPSEGYRTHCVSTVCFRKCFQLPLPNEMLSRRKQFLASVGSILFSYILIWVDHWNMYMAQNKGRHVLEVNDKLKNLDTCVHVYTTRFLI